MSLPSGANVLQRVGGGDINEAYRVALADGREAFVKTRAQPRAAEYEGEAAGLIWLAEPGALRTPAVLELDREYLALEWISPGRLDAAGAHELGRGLALTHAAGAPSFGYTPFDSEEGFGALALPNDPTSDWPQFYAQSRLEPLARLAHDRQTLSSAAIDSIGRICTRLSELCGPPEPPARLHGDLWSGNVMADLHGRPWLVDPSCYGGHREADLAMLSLFGSPSPSVLDAYQEMTPLADGWEQRVELYQLQPLLVHALLFGGSYRGAAERVAFSYGR